MELLSASRQEAVRQIREQLRCVLWCVRSAAPLRSQRALWRL